MKFNPVKTVKESWVKDKVREILKKHKAYYFMPQAGTFGRSGIPDFIVCFHGRFIAIETKAGANSLTELQKMEVDKINMASGTAIVITEKNLDALETMLITKTPTNYAFS